MKNKPTVRQECKRIDSKKARAAEKAALAGDHVKLVRTMHYGVQNRQPPLLDGAAVPQGQKKCKKQIEYCPEREALGEGKKRHYYRVVEETYHPEHYHWQKGWVVDTSETRTRKTKHCMYCGKGEKYGWWRRHRWW